uniref:Uncharacterized protein n=1 Tax=Parascaris equorum TaxID=6256 RepID=A0A914R2E5_PAREQ
MTLLRLVYNLHRLIFHPIFFQKPERISKIRTIFLLIDCIFLSIKRVAT